jgi:hypothetical protein
VNEQSLLVSSTKINLKKLEEIANAKHAKVPTRKSGEKPITPKG